MFKCPNCGIEGIHACLGKPLKQDDLPEGLIIFESGELTKAMSKKKGITMDDLIIKRKKAILATEATIEDLEDSIAHYNGLISDNELALTKIYNGIGWTIAGVSVICFIIGVILWS